MCNLTFFFFFSFSAGIYCLLTLQGVGEGAVMSVCLHVGSDNFVYCNPKTTSVYRSLLAPETCPLGNA